MKVVLNPSSRRQEDKKEETQQRFQFLQIIMCCSKVRSVLLRIPQYFLERKKTIKKKILILFMALTKRKGQITMEQ